MALIQCPECGREISDKAASCPHCGYPIQEKQEKQEKPVVINNTKSIYGMNKEEILQKYNQYRNYLMLHGTNISDDEFVRGVKNGTYDVYKYEKSLRDAQIIPNVNSNIPKCPTCKSTNIKKISATSKVVGGAMFGLFSSKVRNTFECKNCRYKW